jgi:DNA-binding XRE family transcriptional regulator
MPQSKPNKVLLAVRVHLAETQRHMARKSDVNSVTFSRIESGATMIGRDAALKIFKAFRPTFDKLGYTLEDLIMGKKRQS